MRILRELMSLLPYHFLTVRLVLPMFDPVAFIIPLHGSQCSWIVKTLLLRGVTGLLYYKARQFIAFLNVRGDVIFGVCCQFVI